jgi:hypothetical protein
VGWVSEAMRGGLGRLGFRVRFLRSPERRRGGCAHAGYGTRSELGETRCNRRNSSCGPHSLSIGTCALAFDARFK